MCILAHYGLEAYPQACLDDSPEGLQMTADLKRYGCDTRFVTNTPDGGTTLLRVTHKLNPDGTPKIIWVCQDKGCYEHNRHWMEKSGRVCTIELQ